MPKEVVLVDTGVFQPYLQEAVRQLWRSGNTTVTLILDQHMANASVISHLQKEAPGQLSLIYTESLAPTLAKFNFDQRTHMNSEFRQGFWRHCAKRLFILYAYMRQFQKVECFHIENDVMVYLNLTTEVPASLWTPNQVSLCLDHPQRVIPSLLYIPEASLLEPLLAHYDHGTNDMVNLAQWVRRAPQQCHPLPLLPTNPEQTSVIFDGAAIGQYLGGVDPRNQGGDTRGFVNETTVIKYNQYTFEWRKHPLTSNYVPYIITASVPEGTPIVNLHIHSKRLADFNAIRPRETKLIPLPLSMAT